jgi:hypothetical protein
MAGVQPAESTIQRKYKTFQNSKKPKTNVTSLFKLFFPCGKVKH